MRVPFTVSKDSITVFIRGDVKTISSSDSAYPELREHLKRSYHDLDLIETLVNKPKQIARMTEGLVKVVGNSVYYKDKPVHDTLTQKLLDMLDDGFDARPWARFLERVMMNPSMKSREALFNFLETHKTPITADGCFLAFKRVRSDFRDIHSGKFDNSPGRVVQMPREDVDDDSNRTCSRGLHACASSYLEHFYTSSPGYKVVVVKVDPRDVVSIPRDYNFAKMRVCRYVVLDEAEEKTVRTISTSSYYDYEIDLANKWWNGINYKLAVARKENGRPMEGPVYGTLEEYVQPANDWWTGLTILEKKSVWYKYRDDYPLILDEYPIT